MSPPRNHVCRREETNVELQIDVLGSLAVRKGSEQKHLLTGTLADLLGILCLNLAQGNEPLSRFRIASWLWPESDEASSRRSLSKNLYKLKQWLGEYATCIEGDDHSLFLVHVRLDLTDFREAIRSQEFVLKRKALRLYRGPLLEDCSLEWVDGPRADLEREVRQIFQHVCETLRKEGRISEALAIAHRWSRHSPFEEEATRQVMTLYTRIGQPAAALLHYRQFETLLERELALEPEPETQELAETIRLEAQERHEERETSLAWVGRKQERGSLLDAVDSVQNGFGQLVFLTGEPGVGKTRLLESFASSCQLRDVPVVKGFLGELTRPGPYEPFSTLLTSMWNNPEYSNLWTHIPEEVMQSLAPLSPELLPRTPQQSRQLPIPQALQTFVEVASQQQPLVWLLDDLQWMPDEAWDVLDSLASLTEECALLLVCSYRKEELQMHPVGWDFVEQADRRFAPILLPIQGFSVKEVQQLAVQMGRRLSVEECQTLHFQTEGHPLFVVEALENPVSDSIQTLHAMFEERLSALSAESREVLEMASLLGRSFSHVFWQKVSEQDVLKALPELYEQRLLTKTEHGYRFPNDILRQTLQRQIPAARKRRWHEWVGQALREEERDWTEQIWHFEQAKQWGRAFQACEEALKEARSIFAHSRVHVLTEQGLRILEHMPSSEEQQWELIFQRLAYTGLHTGEELMEESVPLMIELSDSFDEHDPRRCTTYRTMAELQRRKGNVDEGIKWIERGLSILPEGQFTVEHMKAWTNLSRLYRSKGDLTKTQYYLRKSLDQIEVSNPFWIRLQNSYASNWLFFFEYEKAYEALFVLWKQQPPQMSELDRVLIQNNLALSSMMSGHLGQAWELIQSKVKYCVEHQQIRALFFAHLMAFLILEHCGNMEEAGFHSEQMEITFQRLEQGSDQPAGLEELRNKWMLRLAMLKYKLGEYEESVRLTTEHQSTASQTKLYDYETHSSIWVKMKSLLALKRWEEVLELGDKALDSWPEQGHKGWASQTLVFQAEALKEQGKSREAEEKATLALEWIGDWSAPPEHWSRLITLLPLTQKHIARERGQLSLQQYSTSLAQFPELQASYLRQPYVQQLRSDDKYLVKAELVRQGVSLGRSLSEKDRICIFWTPDAGEEDRLVQKEQGKKGLRHHRIRRLLKEAELQGAACTDKDLAQALAVSVRTIERDMKELREEGLEVLTRRRR